MRDLAAAYTARETDPVDVLEALDKRIERINPHLNAIIARNPGAMAAARESSERFHAGRPLSALDGVPFTVKDSILVGGLPCTWGSRMLQDYVPSQDELPVARLRAAGAIVIGKTNVPEFTLEGYTNNPLFGVTRNPWNPALTPGGSSGGAVASIAAGLGAFALGTDGGGSIRRPASHAGLVGLKPSIGRVARGPSLPQILLDMEVIGPIARSVADCRLIFDAVARPDRSDRKSLYGPDPRPNADPPRILYVPRFGNAPIDPQVLASTNAAARMLEALGAQVVEGDLPFDVGPLTEFWPLLGQVGVAYILDAHPAKAHLAAERWRSIAEEGRRVPAARYLAGLDLIEALRRIVTEAFANVEFIMTPSAAALPWAADQQYPEAIDGQPVGPRGHAVYAGWVNACGHPAISVPCAPSREGMPIGFQLVGRFGADEQVLDLALQYESAQSVEAPWPPIALS